MKTDSSLIKLNVLQERVDNMIRENSDEHAEILKKIGEINNKLDTIFVTQTEFRPVKSIVLGMVTIILTAFAAGIIKLVFF